MRLCVLACAAAIALGLGGGIGGCGWTPRDEFAASRTVVVHPKAGDGSRVTSGWDARQVAQKSGAPARVAGARDDE
jgi:hypothetical protein